MNLALSGVLLLAALALGVGCGGIARDSSNDESDGDSSSAGGTTSTGGAGDGVGGTSKIACKKPGYNPECDGFGVRYGEAKSAVSHCLPKSYGICGGEKQPFPTLAECIDACGAPARDSCTTSADCVVRVRACCSPCEPFALEDLEALNVAYASQRECGDASCGACPNYGGLPQFPQFAASCEAGRCVAYDVRTSALAKCNQDRDCKLRNGLNWCEGCDDRNWVAIRTDVDPDAWSDGLLSCTLCYPSAPDDRRATCEAGFCAVTPIP